MLKIIIEGLYNQVKLTYEAIRLNKKGSMAIESVGKYILVLLGILLLLGLVYIFLIRGLEPNAEEISSLTDPKLREDLMKDALIS